MASDAALFPIHVPDRGVWPTTRKYLKILRASLVERMTYRADFILGTLFRFLPILTTILLWRSIYSGAGKLSGNGANLSGFTYDQMIAYLLLTNISRLFSSMPGLAAGIARDVREGTIKRYLIQPVDMIGYLLSYRIAHKLAYIVGSFVPYLILFYLCRSYFEGWPDPLTFLAYFVSCILAFLVGVLLRGLRGDGLVLVPRSDEPALHRHDLELLHLRPHAPARPAAPPLVRHPQVAAVPVHGLLSSGRLPGEGSRHGSRHRPDRGAGLGCFLHRAGSLALQARAQAL
jgi:hypothetical protein